MFLNEQTHRKTATFEKKNYTGHPSNQTGVVCEFQLNSLVFEQFVKTSFYVFYGQKKNGQIDRQTKKEDFKKK